VKWCKVFEDKGLGLYLPFAFGIKSLFSKDGLGKVFKREDLILPVKAGLFSPGELPCYEL
jgi:hypothetical protein